MRLIVKNITSKYIYFLLILFCFSLAFSLLVIQDFSGSLAGMGDTEYWEYTGFYFAKNFDFTPLPQLNIINNQAFYPYGVNSVFQPWSLEKDILYAIFYSLFGFGPWLQIYYILTIIITFVGTFRLLLNDYGFSKATGVGLLVSFCNFYAIYKYPGHLSYSIIHWTTLSIIVDFLIVKKYTLQAKFSLKMILIRICLLILCLGQELGYIAGFALTSFTVSFLYVVLIGLRRYFKTAFKSINIFNIITNDCFICRKVYLLIPLIFCLLLGCIYLPLIIQISREAKSFDFTGINSGAWWVSPLRLFIPYIPILNPEILTLNNILKDMPEEFFDGRPGLFIVIIGFLGVWLARKQIAIFVPLIIIFLACLFYHPSNLPILKLFPWFTFNRLATRSTVIYPTILSIFALYFDLNWLRNPRKQIITGVLIVLACTEIFTVYSYKLNYKPYILDEGFFSYMNYVKKQPGEAVLDWPFCITGGNGVGADRGLCPYYWKNGSIFALRRFHEKKIMGQYFGRLHPSQLNSYLKAGWNSLLFPNSYDITKATQLSRCFRPDEWSFFTEFFKYNDFAGINLYTDLVPDNCVQEFYKRFGQPVVKTVILGPGKVEFIAKSSELRSQVNLGLGSRIKFKPLLDFAEANLITSSSSSSFLSITGLSVTEGTTSNKWRWALGSDSSISFRLPESQLLKLSFAFNNPIEAQNIIVEFNGETKAIFKDLKKDAIVNHDIKIKAIKGINHIVFKYKDWNTNKVTFAHNDSRPMSIRFNKLVIEKTSN
ncbi:hypothetical protein [Rivularia sp. UHCC 0363]|uniref:hypothetical protein n=1 Tax=Rivularia sp. UHCC 0363 TaxID=3110244 RepID=UPI002B21A0C7|nr:hypothetical protein [Rivularia sp. UHCC 0363]MEA5597532.1 hypothetical protein [Rivularia sp. UHCC 0363]